jgi:gluconolactonase
VEQNIDRWISQFTQPDGKSTRGSATVKERQIAGQQVHTVDISGTYRDQLGPFAPATDRENYRLLGAIIVTERLGRYYLKMVGPKATVDANEKAFEQVVESLSVKAP